jgi:hypothetical protein
MSSVPQMEIRGTMISTARMGHPSTKIRMPGTICRYTKIHTCRIRCRDINMDRIRDTRTGRTQHEDITVRMERIPARDMGMDQCRDITGHMAQIPGRDITDHMGQMLRQEDTVDMGRILLHMSIAPPKPQKPRYASTRTHIHATHNMRWAS